MITGNGKIQNIYIYPDISVEQGSNTLDILSYKGTVLLKPNATKSLYTNERRYKIIFKIKHNKHTSTFILQVYKLFIPVNTCILCQVFLV